MKKTIAAAVLLGGCMLLTGCEQQEILTNKSQQETEKAKGYVDTMAALNKQSREKIEQATKQENEKLDDALSTLSDETQNNNQSDTSMQNIPSQIDMSLADTCKGATISTNKGDITVEFNNSDAPVTVANFCTLAKNGFYDGVIFHRVIKGFMIQGGDPTGTGTGGPGYKFDDELPEAGAYKIGSLAMANAGPNTNGSQFFIVTGDDGVHLPPLYTLFGQVTSGMDVATTIENVKTGAQDKPVEDITIRSVKLIQQ